MSDDPCPYQDCGNPDCLHRRKTREKAVAMLAAEIEPPDGAVAHDGGVMYRYSAKRKQWIVSL
jgi:hypothetical protein